MNKKYIYLAVGIIILAIAGRILIKILPKTISPNVENKNLAASPIPLKARLELVSQDVITKYPADPKWKHLEAPQEIEPGVSIRTSATGRAIIYFPNGTVTRIDKNTQITLKEFNFLPFAARVNISSGRIWTRVVKLLGGETYESESSNLVATIRGTSYGHEVTLKGENKLIVTENKIKAACNNLTQEEEVPEDYKGQFDCKLKVKPKISKLTEAEKKEAWLIYNQEEDSKFPIDEESATPSPSPETSPIPTLLKILRTLIPKTSPTPIPTSTPTPSPTASSTPSPLTRDKETPTPTPIKGNQQLPIDQSNPF